MTGYWLHLAIGLGIIWGSIAVMVAQRMRIDAQDFTIACLRERLARRLQADEPRTPHQIAQPDWARLGIDPSEARN